MAKRRWKFSNIYKPFLGECFLPTCFGSDFRNFATVAFRIQSKRALQMPRLSVPTCRRLFHLSSSGEDYLPQFHARYNLGSDFRKWRSLLGFTIFCVILNLMEFKYLCFLFFKARVKLTAKRSHPILPKPSSFRNFPAYEPLGKPLGKFLYDCHTIW